MKNTVTIAELKIGDTFYKAQDKAALKPLQLHAIEKEGARYVAVPANTEPELRHKEFLQVWLSPNDKVVPETMLQLQHQ